MLYKYLNLNIHNLHYNHYKILMLIHILNNLDKSYMMLLLLMTMKLNYIFDMLKYYLLENNNQLNIEYKFHWKIHNQLYNLRIYLLFYHNNHYKLLDTLYMMNFQLMMHMFHLDMQDKKIVHLILDMFQLNKLYNFQLLLSNNIPLYKLYNMSCRMFWLL